MALGERSAEDLGQQLRAARRGRSLSIIQIAAAMSVSHSYVSGVETGSKQPSASFLRKYAVALGLPEAHFLQQRGEQALGRIEAFPEQLFKAFIGTPFYDVSGASRIAAGKLDANTSDVIDCATDNDMRAAFRDMVHRETAHGEAGVLTMLWSARYYDEAAELFSFIINTIVPHFIKSGGRLRHLLRNPTDSADILDTTIMLIGLSKKFARYQNYRCMIVPTIAIRHMPADLYQTRHSGFIAAMASQPDLAPTTGFYVESPVGTMSAYNDLLVGSAAEPVQLFVDTFAEFLPPYALTEAADGDRSMIQRHLAAITRPALDYNRGTDWWRRYMLRYDDDAKIQRMADHRLTATLNLNERMGRHKVRQIACIESMHKWAATGLWYDTAHYGKHPEHYWESPAERRRRIDNIRALIGTHESFNVAAVPEESWRELTGVRVCGSSVDAGWVAQGQATVVIEITELGKPAGESSYQAIIDPRNSCVAQEFQLAFEADWKALPEASKSRRAAMSFFESLKQKVPFA